MTELHWTPFVVAALAATLIAGAGAWATDLSDWYYRLRKPSWQPPDWVFGPAWTLIFALAAASAGLAWIHAPDAAARLWMVLLFVFNGVVNILWSVLFFSLKRPRWALAEVAVLWLSVLALILFTQPFSALASVLLLPYLLWVSFAALLNLSIIRLNTGVG